MGAQIHAWLLALNVDQVVELKLVLEHGNSNATGRVTRNPRHQAVPSSAYSTALCGLTRPRSEVCFCIYKSVSALWLSFRLMPGLSRRAQRMAHAVL